MVLLSCWGWRVPWDLSFRRGVLSSFLLSTFYLLQSQKNHLTVSSAYLRDFVPLKQELPTCSDLSTYRSSPSIILSLQVTYYTQSHQDSSQYLIKVYQNPLSYQRLSSICQIYLTSSRFYYYLSFIFFKNKFQYYRILN